MTQKTWIAGAVAAMFIAAAPALLAQDDTTAPAAPPMAMTMPPPMATPQAIDLCGLGRRQADRAFG
jgi:hypothetical protein